MPKARSKQKRKKAGARADARDRRRPAAAGADQALRRQLAALLGGGNAHVDFDRVIADFPAHHRGGKIPGAPHTPWQLLEHLRIAQWDILEFTRNPRHVSPPFPAGYWPPTEAPPDAAAWERSVRSFRADLQAMIALVRNPRTDLFARISHGEGQTALREALLVADHNAYHLGQLVLLRKLTGCWSGT
ncbi:MAG TPA: DinB family protein [Candidatus Acidoferrales bacterium]|nr:DinB family protein [Candidatus Acidoferrales bacterium]